MSRALFLVGVLFLPLQDFTVFGIGGRGLLLADACFAFAIAVRLLAWLGGVAPFRWDAVHVGWIAYVLAMGVACLVSPDMLSSAGKWVGVVYLAVLAAVAMDLALAPEFARKLVLTFVASGAVTALFAVIGAAGFYLLPGHPWVAPLLSHYGSLPDGPYPRVDSLFANANMMCNHLVVVIVLLLAAMRLEWVPVLAGRGLLAMLTAAALLTISPGLGGLALGLGIWSWWSARDRSPGPAIAFFVGGVLVAAVVLLAVAGVTLGAPIEQSTVRWLIWQDALGTWFRHPWFGAGLDQDVAGVAYITPSGHEQWLTDAHNVWLNIAGQAGLTGVLATLIACVLLLRGRWPAMNVAGTQGTLRIACAIAFIAAFLYGGLAGSFEDARHLWVLMGLLAAQSVGTLRQSDGGTPGAAPSISGIGLSLRRRARSR